MALLMVGIGGLEASCDRSAVLKTMALGSCIAVMILDPGARCVAMVHIALPDSTIAPDKARTLPGYFADTGIPALLTAMLAAGAKADRSRYIVKLVGGANVSDPNNTFNIGKRNALAIKKILWTLGLVPKAEDIGGRISRTVSLEASTGKVRVTSPGRPEWEV